MRISRIANFVINLAFAYALVGLIAGELHLFNSEGSRVVSSAAWTLVAAGVLFIAALTFLLRRYLRGFRLSIEPWPFLFGLMLYFAGDVAARNYTFFLGSEVRVVAVIFGAAALLFLFFSERREERIGGIAWLLFLQVVLSVLFIRYADGRFLLSDDHPSFLYRLILLRDNFPNIPFYNTDWNAAYNAREFFPSGVLNVFVLFSPVLYLVGNIGTVEWAALYNLIIPYLYIFLIPWSVYLAARLLCFDSTAAVLGAVFSLAPSMSYFEWLLKYGTIGFVLSAGLLPLMLALSIRLAIDDKLPKYWHALLLLLVSFCCLTWSLAAATVLPVLLYALFRFRHTFAVGRRGKVLFFAACFCVINGPWLVTFVQQSRVLQFVSGDQLPGSNTRSFSNYHSKHGEASGAVDKEALPSSFSAFVNLAKRNLRHFRESLVKTNPVLLFFFIPGLALIRERAARRAVGITVLWLLFIAAVGDSFKPQLELRRMVVPASFIMAVLAGASVYALGRRAGSMLKEYRSPFHPQVAAAVLSLVFLFGVVGISPLTAGAAYLNRSDEKFSFSNETVLKLVKKLQSLEDTGRVFVSGFILHELGAASITSQNGGHLAPLPAFTGKSFYASDFYHSRWSSIDPIPKTYRKRAGEGIEEFLDLVNASYVITFRREWRDYCRKNTSYKQLAKIGRFRIFQRPPPTKGYVLQGSAQVERVQDGLIVVPESEEIVLKYRYFPQLKTSKPELVHLTASDVVFEEDLGGKKTSPVRFIRLLVKPEALQEKVAIKIGFL